MGVGVSRRKPLHAEWTNDKVLLYSTANYIQSPGINCDRKEHLKESVYICVCVELSHLAVEQKLAQRCKSIMPLCLIVQLHLTLCDPMDCSPPGSSVYGDAPGKNTGVGCHALLQGTFPTKGSNPGLSHCRQILYCPSHQGSPRIPGWEAYFFSRGSAGSRNQAGVSCIPGGFFIAELPGKPKSIILQLKEKVPACPLHEQPGQGGWWDNLQGDSGPDSPRCLSPDGHPGLCPVTAPIPMSSAQPEL